MKINEVAYEFRNLILSESSKDDNLNIPVYGKYIIEKIFVPLGIKWKPICRMIEDYLLFRIYDEKIGYVIVGKSNIMWCNNEFTESIAPDDVINYLMEKYMKVKIKIRSDRTVVLNM